VLQSYSQPSENGQVIFEPLGRGEIIMMGFEIAAQEVIYVGSGVLVGAFMPAVGRKIKSAFVKLTTKAKSDLEKRVEALEAKIVSEGSAALKAAEADAKKAETEVKAAI
jgi:hypothetical protein